jgi:hypothetical protein
LIELIALNNEVPSPGGIVYSTSPRTAIGADGRTYYVKGYNDATAFAEVCGCRLAAVASLPVPQADLGLFAGDLYAAVVEVEHKIQNVAPWVNSQAGIVNLEDLFGAVVVDCWLANDDRNMGNLVGTPVGHQRITVSIIDFEKSKTLHMNPTIEAANLEPRRLWPTGELGNKLNQIRPTHPPQRYIDSIRSIGHDAVRQIVSSTAQQLATVTWVESSVDVLVSRAQRIQLLAEEVWQRN